MSDWLALELFGDDLVHPETGGGDRELLLDLCNDGDIRHLIQGVYGLGVPVELLDLLNHSNKGLVIRGKLQFLQLPDN